MKKLITLFLVLTGIVLDANAWGDMYLICAQNDWTTSENDDDYKFTRIDGNNFTLTVPGSYAASSDFYFRFREKDSSTWWNIGPGNVNLDVTNTATYVTANGNNSYAFYVQQGTYDDIRIYLTWKDSKWNVSAVTGGTYTVAFAKPDDWSSVKAYMFLGANSAEVHYLGDWISKDVTYDETSNIYNIEIPGIAAKIIFKDGDSSSQTGNLDVVNNKVYDETGQVANQKVSIGPKGKATYCSKYPLDFSDVADITAYTITGALSNGTLTKNTVTKVPANTGIYLEGTENTNFWVPACATASSLGDNMLVGVTSDTHIGTTTDSYTNFILTVNKLGGDVPTPKFYRVNVDYGNTVLANRAYLQILTSEVSAREFFWFDEDETTTGIDKVADNKQAAEYYNLSGQRVAQPVKGLYIVNGKKVIIK